MTVALKRSSKPARGVAKDLAALRAAFHKWGKEVDERGQYIARNPIFANLANAERKLRGIDRALAYLDRAQEHLDKDEEQPAVYFLQRAKDLYAMRRFPIGGPPGIVADVVTAADENTKFNRAGVRKRQAAAKVLKLKVLKLARSDKKRGRGKRIALTLGIAQSTVSEILNKKNLR